MFKLMKYEMRKTLFMKLVLIAVTAIIEVFFFISYTKDNPTKQGVALFVLALVAIFGILFMGIQSIVALHRDMNTRQSYMLFMTPNSTYGILGAKVLENTLSTLAGGALFIALIFFDVRLLINRYGDVEETLDFLKGMMSGVGVGFELTFAGVASFTCNMLCSWVSTVTLAYLADVIASSLLNGKKGGGFISAVIFVLLTMGVFRVVDLLPGAADTDVNNYVQSAYNLVLAAICYFLTARIMDRYLSV